MCCKGIFQWIALEAMHHFGLAKNSSPTHVEAGIPVFVLYPTLDPVHRYCSILADNLQAQELLAWKVASVTSDMNI
jgi:hypothetical protein